PGGKVIYLTFDDGPSKPYTAQVLDLLARYHARATFFVVGRNVKAYPELVRAIHSAGHVLGNHTYDHVWLNRISHAKFVSQVERTQAVLGHLASSCMRPPNGGTNRNTRPYAAALGLQVVMWNIDPRDWSRPGAARIAARILAQVKPRMTVLMHDGGGNRSQTVAALEVVLRELTQRGYRFEPEPQCKRATPETSHGF
ncbi:MAG: polysaccharide deacetylase family protein, partial [Chloroflexota bacterium]